MGLPFSKMKFRESFSSFDQDLSSIGSENLETVINLQSLIKNRGENVPSTSTPGNPGCAWGLGLLDSAHLFLLIKTPEIHLSFGDVSEATDHQRVTEWANSDRISESLAKLESRLTVNIVHCCSGWLLTRNHNEFLATWSPNCILDLIIKDGNEMSILSFMDSYVLKRMFTVVTFA
jgi:hypothetical protein